MLTLLNQFRKLRQKFGFLFIVRLIFSPVSAIAINPIRWIQSLRLSRDVLNGKFDDYSHFAARNGLLSLFYWTALENLQRFGRTGISPYVGQGNFPLSTWMFWPLTALTAYTRMTPLLPPIAMAFWLFSHFLWYGTTPTTWLLAFIAIVPLTTTFYVQTLATQNYNVLGWAFLPMAVYGLLAENWGVAAFAWIGASAGSPTAVATGLVLSTGSALTLGNWAPLIVLIPATLRCASRLGPTLHDANAMKNLIGGVAKSIGFQKRGARYLYPPTFLSLDTLARFFLFAQFTIVSCLMEVSFHCIVLQVIALGLFLENYLGKRFADSHHIDLVLFTVAAATFLKFPSGALLASLWVLACPPPLSLGLGVKSPDCVPVFQPFPVKKIIQEMELFLKCIQSGQRVLAAYSDPGNNYAKLFDGYHHLIGVPSYLATMREFHYLPDFWAVITTNYHGAPSFWGRSVEEVSRNCQTWKADYVIIYIVEGETLDPNWLTRGFTERARFDWKDHEHLMLPTLPYHGSTPLWILLECPKDLVSGGPPA